MNRSVGKYIAVLVVLLTCIGCANRGIGPQGGPKDSIPPLPLQSKPENGALEFTGNKIDIAFNEYLQLDNISQNLLMSPPQQRPPDVRARGKHVMVHFEDSLRQNTTYTLDFGDAICDFTERNPIHNYTFAFSTGPVIDTLELDGWVFDAENLNPLKGITVGIYSNMEDSAFTTLPFERIGKTDTVGHFYIRNMKPGDYRLFAVNDISRDYCLTMGEALAFMDEKVSPYMPQKPQTPALPDSSQQALDTLPATLDTLSAAVDTLSASVDTLAKPGEVSYILWLFTQTKPRLHLLRTIREKQNMIRILFSAKPDSLPVLRSLTDSVSFHTSYSANCDTLTLWLTDSTSIRQDSIFIEAKYRRTDSLFRMEWATDTLRAFWRAPRLSAKALQLQRKRDKERKLELSSNARTSFDIYDTLRIYSATPLAEYISDSIHLYERIDTVVKPIAFTILPTDSLPLRLELLASLKPGKKYELRLDSAALHDIYATPNEKTDFPLQLKTLEDYSTLRVKLNPYLPDARIQILNNQDKVVRELPAAPEGAFFQYLKPDVYYMRLYRDFNADHVWTTGSWEEHRQPEPVYYFPAKLQTKPNWDFEEEWDYLAVPQEEAKPAELIKASSKKQ